MDDFTEALIEALEDSTAVGRSALESAFIDPERTASVSGDRHREGLPPPQPVGKLPKIL